MIIFRYLSREILMTMTAVTGILLVIIMGGRFIRYFAKAADGRIAADILSQLMFYHMPGFLELVLPLGFFLGILLAYGRLYMDSEMTVLGACGFSPNSLIKYTLIPAGFITLAIALCSLWLTPLGAAKTQALIEAQKQRTDFDAIVPGRFQKFGSGRATYAESLTDDKRQMNRVFISEQRRNGKGDTELSLLVAERGTQYIDPATGSRFLLLEQGYRYQGEPGEPDYQVLQYGKYAVRIQEQAPVAPALKIAVRPTAELLAMDEPRAQAQLQWRLSLPLMVPVITLIAVPLSRVNPRQGRFAKLLPAIFLHITYLSLLVAAQSAVEKQQIPAALGLWWVHALFITIALLLNWGAPLKQRWQRRATA